MSLKSLRSRITLLFTTTLIVSVLCVSGIIYYLLANSLRKSDREFIAGRTRDYINTYHDGGTRALKHLIDDQRQSDDDLEMYVSLVDSEKNEVFTYLPQYIDKDSEDKDEIEQVYRDVRVLPLQTGWHTILLLSGDEDKNFLKQVEFKIRCFVRDQKWQNILPLIDNDNVEIYFTKMDENLWIQVGKSSEEREEQLARIRNIGFAVFIPFLFFGFIVSLILSGSVLRPIKALIGTINRIQSGEQDARALVRGGGDEVDQLSTLFNTLMDSNQKLVRSLKNGLDNVAHDLRTPVTRFRMSAEAALEGNQNNEELLEALSEGVESSEEIMNLLSAMLDVSEAESGTMSLHREEISVQEFFEGLKDLYQFVAEDKNIEIELKVESCLTILGDRIKLGRAFGNLIDNAIKYSNKGEKVSIEARLNGKDLLVLVEDHGMGIPKEDLDRIWERLYRVDHSRSTPGLGIGLSVVQAMIKAHKGSIQIDSTLGKGTTFIVTLPNCNFSERNM